MQHFASGNFGYKGGTVLSQTREANVAPKRPYPQSKLTLLPETLSRHEMHPQRNCNCAAQRRSISSPPCPGLPQCRCFLP
jgi:hypothetical protein